VFTFQGALELDLEPTPAMLKGQQSVFQCSECGTVVVQPRPAAHKLGPCPSCLRSPSWWAQTLPVAGLRHANTPTIGH
jgi:hypothetical protein